APPWRPARVSPEARVPLPGVGAVAPVSAIGAATAGAMPAGVAVVLLVAAVGAGAWSGGIAPAATAGGAALPAWWYLGLPFNLVLFAAFVLGGLLLATAGEGLVRSRRPAADPPRAPAMTQRRRGAGAQPPTPARPAHAAPP